MSAIVPLMPPVQELPPAMQALRADRERAFVWLYMFNGANGSKAAREAGYSDVKEGAKVRAHGLLHRADIQEALRELTGKYLFSLAPVATIRLGALLKSKNERVALKAVDMTLSRTGFAERTALDVNVSGEVTVDHTDAAVADLRRLRELGLPREKLVETFGYSGLARYEKLLEAADKAKVVEAEIVND